MKLHIETCNLWETATNCCNYILIQLDFRGRGTVLPLLKVERDGISSVYSPTTYRRSTRVVSLVRFCKLLENLNDVITMRCRKGSEQGAGWHSLPSDPHCSHGVLLAHNYLFLSH